jgi:hypothetical protein
VSSKKFKDKLESHKNRILAASKHTGRQPKKGIINAVATCNAKHLYATRELALAPGFRVYKCDLCFGFHRSSLPSENSLTHQINKKVKQK